MCCNEWLNKAVNNESNNKSNSTVSLRADCMNATQISTQLSPLNLLSLLKSSLKHISLHETNAFSI